MLSGYSYSQGVCEWYRFCLTLHCLLTSVKLVDLFAIIKMLDKLEQAYIRDAVSAKDYEPACEKLISQYKTLYETMRELVSMHAVPCIEPDGKHAWFAPMHHGPTPISSSGAFWIIGSKFGSPDPSLCAFAVTSQLVPEVCLGAVVTLGPVYNHSRCLF